MLYAFDLDGTLISSYMDNPDKDYHSWQMLPGRMEAIGRLTRLGHEVAIVTNQGGVAFGLTTEDDFCRKIGRVAMALGYACVDIHDGRPDGHLAMGWGGPRLQVHVCYSDSRARDRRYQVDAHRRKPAGTMIREAIAGAGAYAEDGVIYVGDRPEDAAAARDAGVRFSWAADFFGD